MNRMLYAALLLLALVPAVHAKTAKEAKPVQVPALPPGVLAAPNSFHGILWGTPLADIKDMTVQERNGQAAYAKVTGASPRIADVAVTDLVYAFCQDRFAGAMATFQGRDRFEAILKLMTARYGQPVKPAESSENLGWPMGDVLIMLEFDAPILAGTLSYLHAPTYAPCESPVDQAAPPAEPQAGPQTTP